MRWKVFNPNSYRPRSGSLDLKIAHVVGGEDKDRI